jgi:hypothetical protein
MKRECKSVKEKFNHINGWENFRRDKKARQSPRNVKVFLIFLYGKGFFHHEFVPRGQTFNGQFYLEVMKRLREAERKKKPEGWKNKTWMLHHDNAPALTSILVREFWVKHEITVVPNRPTHQIWPQQTFILLPG